MTLQSFLRRLYVFSFLKWFAPIWAVEKLFMQQQGLSLQDVSHVLTLWMIGMLICEVPTGIIADRYPRKWVLFVATLLSIAHFFLSSRSNTTLGFALSWLLYAPSLSLVSGTLESYLHDVLSGFGEEQHFARYWGRASSLTTLGSGIAIGLGGIIAQYSYQWAYAASIAAMIGAILAVLSLPNTPAYQHEGERPSILGHVGQGLRVLMSSRTLREAALFGAFLVAASTTYDEYQEFYLQFVHIPLAWIGIFAAVMGGIVALANTATQRVMQKVSLPMLALGATVAALGMAVFHNVLGALLSIPFFVCVTIGETIADSSVQHHATAAQRATIASLVNASKQSSIILVLIFAQLSERFSLAGALYLIAGCGLVFLLISGVDILRFGRQPIRSS
jgi:MFS family permease